MQYQVIRICNKEKLAVLQSGFTSLLYNYVTLAFSSGNWVKIGHAIMF